MLGIHFTVKSSKSVEEVINSILSHSTEMTKEEIGNSFNKTASLYYCKIKWNRFLIGWTVDKGKGIEIEGVISANETVTMLECKFGNYKELFVFYLFFTLSSLGGLVHSILFVENNYDEIIMMLLLLCMGGFALYRMRQRMLKNKEEFKNLINATEI
jgi:hypothetical protein